MTETPPPVDYVAQAQLVHDNGPYKTPPSTLYFHFLKPAWGDQPEETIVSHATNAEMYLRMGYTITGEETIENLVEWNAQNATKAAPEAKAKSERRAASPRRQGQELMPLDGRHHRLRRSARRWGCGRTRPSTGAATRRAYHRLVPRAGRLTRSSRYRRTAHLAARSVGSRRSAAVSVSGITATGATVNFTLSQSATKWIDYGTTAAYGRATRTWRGNGAQSNPLTGLVTGTVYHYRIGAQTAGGLDRRTPTTRRSPRRYDHAGRGRAARRDRVRGVQRQYGRQLAGDGRPTCRAWDDLQDLSARGVDRGRARGPGERPGTDDVVAASRARRRGRRGAIGAGRARSDGVPERHNAHRPDCTFGRGFFRLSFGATCATASRGTRCRPRADCSRAWSRDIRIERDGLLPGRRHADRRCQHA